MSKKFWIIIGIIAVITIAAIFISRKNSSDDSNSSATNGKWDLSKGTWTETQREAALNKLINDWFPNIISKNWDCVKNKNAEKLLNDSISQIWLNVTNHVKSVGKDDSATYLAFPIDVNKGWSDLLENMKINGVYAYALEEAKTKLQ